MKYIVHAVEPDSIHVWDCVTRDPRNHKPYTVTLVIPDHGYEVGDEVEIVVRLVGNRARVQPVARAGVVV